MSTLTPFFNRLKNLERKPPKWLFNILLAVGIIGYYISPIFIRAYTTTFVSFIIWMPVGCVLGFVYYGKSFEPLVEGVSKTKVFNRVILIALYCLSIFVLGSLFTLVPYSAFNIANGVYADLHDVIHRRYPIVQFYHGYGHRLGSFTQFIMDGHTENVRVAPRNVNPDSARNYDIELDLKPAAFGSYKVVNWDVVKAR